MLLLLVFLSAAWGMVTAVWNQGWALPPVGLRSREPFGPALLALLSLLALGRVHPKLRPSPYGLVLGVCWVAWSLGFHVPVSGDVTPTQYTALSMARGEGTSLDAYRELTVGGLPYYVIETPRGLRSEFAIGPALVSWPVFLTASLSDVPRPVLVDRLGRLSAMLIALACVWLVMTIGRRLEPPFSPWILALAYGLGTTHWSIASAALWQHGTGELWILGALERMLDEEQRPSRRLLALGACMTLAVFSRPPLGPAVVVIAVLALLRYGKRVWVAFMSAAIVAVPLAVDHLQTYGSILGAYGSRMYALSFKPPGELMETMFWLVASPSRGVLWFEPVVLFTLVVTLWSWKRSPSRVLVLAGWAGFLATLALYGGWNEWWGGYTFGPRYMTDALPWWVLAVAAAGSFRAGVRRATLLLVTLGIGVNLLNLVDHIAEWNRLPPIETFPDRLKSVGDSQLVLAVLASWPGDNRVRLGMTADAYGEGDTGLSLWSEEWACRPWFQYSAFRMADLLFRTDRLEDAIRHTDEMAGIWPGSSYVRHLQQRLPAINGFMNDEAWLTPLAVRVSRNRRLAPLAGDSRLGTLWTTGGPQRRGDWVELELDPRWTTRAVLLISAPDFENAPSGLELSGTDPSGQTVRLARVFEFSVRRKGWVIVRFPPARLASLRVEAIRNHGATWSLSEARLLVVEP